MKKSFSPHRLKLLNFYSDTYQYQDYLEIGLARGECISSVKCRNKTGVDPDISRLHKIPADIEIFEMTSDTFFQINKKKFDLIFIDGSHRKDDFINDVICSLEILKPEGTIICHDVSPPSEAHQKTDLSACGHVWKGWIHFRQTMHNIKMQVVDSDNGCGIINPGKQELLSKHIGELNWENLQKYKKEWLNIIESPIK